MTPGGDLCRETVGTVSERELAPAMTCGMSDFSSDVDVSQTEITPHDPKTEPELEEHPDIKPGESARGAARNFEIGRASCRERV